MSAETISTARRWSMLVIALTATTERQRVHQRCGVPHPDPAHRTRTRPRGGGPAVVDAELRTGAHAHRMGLRRRPGRRTDRVGPRLGAHRRSRVRGRVGATHCSPSARSCFSAEWRPQAAIRPAAGWWSAGSRRTNADWSWASAKPRTPLGVGLGALVIPRVGRKPRRLGGAVVPRGRVRGIRGRVRGGRDRSAAAAALRGPGRAPGQSVPGVDGVDADPRRLRASRRAPGGVVDVRAGVADDRPRVVGSIGRRHHHGGPGVGRRWPNRRRPLVGSGGLATEADPHHRAGGRRLDGTVGADGLAQFAGQRGDDGRSPR